MTTALAMTGRVMTDPALKGIAMTDLATIGRVTMSDVTESAKSPVSDSSPVTVTPTVGPGGPRSGWLSR